MIPTYKLGKQARRFDSRTRLLQNYIAAAALTAAPTSYTAWQQLAIVWAMLLNDKLGDCTLAAILHAKQLWRAAAGYSFTPTDGNALSMYEALGYDPEATFVDGQNPTDGGEVVLDVLNYVRNVGYPDGSKISTYVALNVLNSEHVKWAIWQTGCAYIGVQLPQTAQGQSDWVPVYTAPLAAQQAGSWGGHCVIVIGYDADWLYFVSWGQLMRMSWPFWNLYCDESYAITSNDFITAKGVTPLGLEQGQLDSDVELIAA